MSPRRTRTGQWAKGQSGNPTGRPIGAKDLAPRTAKAAIQTILEMYAQDQAWQLALEAGLRARPPYSAPYLRLLLDHIAGFPDQPLRLNHTIILSPRD